jgi:hypothetical protein
MKTIGLVTLEKARYFVDQLFHPFYGVVFQEGLSLSSKISIEMR